MVSVETGPGVDFGSSGPGSERGREARPTAVHGALDRFLVNDSVLVEEGSSHDLLRREGEAGRPAEGEAVGSHLEIETGRQWVVRDTIDVVGDVGSHPERGETGRQP